MDLNDESVGTCRHRRHGKGGDILGNADGVAGVDDNGQMAQSLDDGDRRDIKGVAGLGLEGLMPRSQRMT